MKSVGVREGKGSRYDDGDEVGRAITGDERMQYAGRERGEGGE